MKYIGFYCILCAGLLAGCAVLPPRPLYTETFSEQRETATLQSQFDVSYTIHYHVMKKQKQDFVSIVVDTMLYEYRLDFYAQKDFEAIVDSFLKISDMASTQNKKNGYEYLTQSTLYAYGSYEDKMTRLAVNGIKPNWVGFSFLLKDGEHYLVINTFHAESLSDRLNINNTVESIPIHYDDVKKISEFLKSREVLESIRSKQLSIAKAARMEKDIPKE